MSSIYRQPSHTTSTTSVPPSVVKSRLGFFKKLSVSGPSSFSARKSPSENDPGDFVDSASTAASNQFKTPASLGSVHLEPAGSINGTSSPDGFRAAIRDPEFIQLRDNITRLRKAPYGSDAKNVDAAWEIYKKLREESLQTCRNLVQKSQIKGQNGTPGHVDTTFHESRLSLSSTANETPNPWQVNDQWLTAINEYKSILEGMLQNLETSLYVTYKNYEESATSEQWENFLSDKLVRKNMIIKWRDSSVHRMRSEKLLFWDLYKIRSLNFDKLKLDLQAMDRLFVDPGEVEEELKKPFKEHVIANNGDTILEFANGASEISPVLRFRVSSHLLAAASPLFSRFLLPKEPGDTRPLEYIKKLPPAPTPYEYDDGTEAQLFKMPQIETNENNALTILLHAAHMHHSYVPRKIDFPVFVSIAEVCLRYQCISPLELQVEYQWLPQWIHLISDDNVDGFLLISYAFGMRRIFTRMSKTAILNCSSNEEIDSKTCWPQAIRDKIKATRAAKIAQVHECCKAAIGEYFRHPSDAADHRASIASLQTITRKTRCPKGSQLCDATNLGWLMLAYNELRILPSIMKDVNFPHMPEPAERSLKDLFDCLKLMPSSPQVHNGVCDYSSAFRSDIFDISNSIVGLKFHDVSGRDGWGISRNTVTTDNLYDDLARDMIEMSASSPPPDPSEQTLCETAFADQDIGFRILSQFDEMGDLACAALLNKSFYAAYKRNEAALLRNIMRAERRRGAWQDTLLRLVHDKPKQEARTSRPVQEGETTDIDANTNDEAAPIEDKVLLFEPVPVSQDERVIEAEETYESSPPYSPLSTNEVLMTEEEASRILWGDVVNVRDADERNEDKDDDVEDDGVGKDREATEKCLLGDVVEDKARWVEESKNLREERDRILGIGAVGVAARGEEKSDAVGDGTFI